MNTPAKPFMRYPMPGWLYFELDGATDLLSHIPAWVIMTWPKTHFCFSEWDGLLLTDGMEELECCGCFRQDEEI